MLTTQEQIEERYIKFLEKNRLTVVKEFTLDEALKIVPNLDVKNYPRWTILSFIHTIREEDRVEMVKGIDEMFNYPCDCARNQKSCEHKWSHDFIIIRKFLLGITKE